MQPLPADGVIDCLVVGAGPAGLTAAMYLRRYLRSVLLADGGESRALWIDHSRNVPGHPDGVSGRELLARLRQQFAVFGGEVVPGEVTALERLADGGPFAARVAGRGLVARTVLLATGVVDAVPALPGVADLQRRGLLRQCPICDGHEHRGRRIAVLGDGAHAEAEARFIGHYSPHVQRIGLAEARALVPLPGGGVRIEREGHAPLAVDVVYAALGVRPRTALAQALGAREDERGALVADAHGRTSVAGVWAAGDVVSALDQVAVALGHGAITATSIHNTLGT